MKSKNKTRAIWRLTKRSGIILGLGLGLLIVMLVWMTRELPNPKKLSTYDYPESSQIFDRKERLLYEIYADKHRVSVKLNEVPDNLKKATLAIEDANFYHHLGFDLKGIIRGLYRTFFKDRKQGGSTITQQLVKNGLLTQERTWSRKIKEAFLTIATEILYSKDQILEMYFNQTPYGGTLWGAQAAAKGIFNKQVSELSLGEAALLAGLPGSPTRYSPFTHPDAAKKRQELVLTRMEELKYITHEEAQKARGEKLNYNFEGGNILAPHFVFYVKEQLVDKYGSQKVNQGGLKVITTLDLDLQNYVQTAIASEIGKLNKYNVTNGAGVVSEAKTGQILAMVGSKDYDATDIDGKYNVTTALRQPGSSIKPLNYAIGLELNKVTPASIFEDGPICYNQPGQKSYCPTNYGNKYYGIQTLRNSLANSLNIPAVKMLEMNAIETFVASASAMGITTFNEPSQYGLSLTLGGGEVMMVDMNVAFGVLANSGVKKELTSILKVTNRNGEVIDEYQDSPGKRVLSRETAFLITHILSDDGARSMVFGRGSMLNIKNHPEVAVKTGTTNDLRDNWTIGYTPEYVTAVWVGNNNNTKMNGVVSGTTGAAPIWNKIMTEVLKNKPIKKMTIPGNVIGMNVCNLTGLLPPTEGCEAHYEYFKKDNLPKRQEFTRRSVLIDKSTGRLAREEDNLPNTEYQEHTLIQEAGGNWVCLDCPIVASPTP